MSENAYERVKGGRLTFKGGAVASRSNFKAIDKKKKKKKNKDKEVGEGTDTLDLEQQSTGSGGGGGGGAEMVYTIDAAKKMKYEELFPVETKKFGYDPNAKVKSVEEALDDRVKKKADRYCK